MSNLFYAIRMRTRRQGGARQWRFKALQSAFQAAGYQPSGAADDA
jgi:hypothetical protein